MRVIFILHDFIRTYDVNTYPYEIYVTINKTTEARLENLPNHGRNATRDALTVRKKQKNYFS